MSPLWRNRLCIAISPERISVLKLGRGLKPKLLGHYDEVLSISGKQPIWQAAVEKLAELLAKPEWNASEADIVLSNRLTQYTTITFNSELKKYSEQEAFARHVLTQTHGPIAGQWELRIQRGKENMPCLVSAIDRSLLESLRQVCASQKIKLRSITPHLVPVFNHFRGALKAAPAWLVLNEPGHSLFALLNKGEFSAINGVSHVGIGELPTLLDRENLITALPEPCKTIYLHAPSGDGLSVLPASGYDVQRLEIVIPEDFPPLGSGLYALAFGGRL